MDATLGARQSARARTLQGTVRGSVVDDVYVFKGIPYAAPPFGPNRFTPPQPREPWSGELEVTAFGAKPIQPPYPPPWDVLIPEPDAIGEDCLNLNIFTPDLAPAAHPVMVWIPGGQFEHGTSSTYDGSRFARDGVVCVTINYRVGAEGFLYLGEESNNLGLLDQIAALEWVRDNIAAFGGDPGEVTVFGESAGAMSIGMLLAMPRAKGLFRRAITQSGGAEYVMTLESAKKVAHELASRLGIEPEREAFAAIEPQALLAAQVALKAELMNDRNPERWGLEVVRGSAPWAPVIDGRLIPSTPLERIAAGAGAEVTLLAGANDDEYRFFTVPGGMIDQVTAEMPAMIAGGYGLPVDKALAAYGANEPGATPGDVMSAIMTDWYFRMPALHLADAHVAGGGVTYAYEFSWDSPAYGGRLGACHGLEIAFVYGILGDDPEAMFGPNPPLELVERMHAAWISFATHGDPGWPRYDLEKRPTMRFDVTSKVVDDPLATVREVWEHAV